MKKILFLFCLCVCSVRAGDSSSRFELFSTEVPVLVRDGHAPATKRLFKLDTVTGQTWVYYEGEIGTNVHLAWIPVPHQERLTLETQIAQAQEVIAWASANPSGAVFTNADGSVQTFDAPQMRRYLSQAVSKKESAGQNLKTLETVIPP